MGKSAAMAKAKSKTKAVVTKVKTVAKDSTKKGNNTKAVAAATKEQKVEDTQEKDTEELTEKNVGKHNVDTLIQKLKSGQLEDDKFLSQLDNKQKMVLWKRFEVARTKNTGAADQWNSLKQLGRGQQKGAKQKMLLLAFVKHGTCGEGYMKVLDSLTQTRTKTENMRWLSWKETTDKYGDAEAKSRVQQGSLPVRKDPRDARFFQFLVVEDSSQLTLAQQRELQAARETKLPSADFKQLSGCIRMDMDDDIMEDVWDEKFEGVMALKDLKDKVQEDVSEDADDDEDGLPKDLRYQLGLGGASKDKTKGKADKPDKKNNFDDKVDMMSQVGDGNSAVALRKCNVMHALLSKQTLKIRQLEASLLKKKCWPRASTPPSRSSLTRRKGWTRVSLPWTKPWWRRKAPWNRRRSSCWTAPPTARRPRGSSSCCRTWTRSATDAPSPDTVGRLEK
jgi:hypothetical protein